VAEKASAAVKDELGASARELRSWLRRARATRAIFGHLVDEQNRGKRVRFRARALIQDVADQVDILLRNASVEASGVAASLRLPPATQAEWSGIFQNVFLNAAEALRETDVKEIVVSSRTRGDVREIFVQDTGVGVDLSEAERLFEPFTRGSRASRDRRASAHGGTGLGLTIVRMIASSIGCQVAFVDPDPGFTTAFQLSWTETE
jgi:signal transduction histidine kinase